MTTGQSGKPTRQPFTGPPPDVRPQEAREPQTLEIEQGEITRPHTSESDDLKSIYVPELVDHPRTPAPVQLGVTSLTNAYKRGWEARLADIQRDPDRYRDVISMGDQFRAQFTKTVGGIVIFGVALNLTLLSLWLFYTLFQALF